MWEEFDYSVQLGNFNPSGIYKLGEDNIADVQVLGVKAEFTFAIIPDPVEKITVVPTKTIQEEKDGSWIECSDAAGSYFDYDISETEPQITVEYNELEKLKHYCKNNNINITEIEYFENIICKIEIAVSLT